MQSNKKVLQIIPADGWHAVFAIRGETGGPELESVPLCSWGLVELEDAGDVIQTIKGFGATDVIDPCDEYDGLIGYVHASDPEGPEKYREDAKRVLRWMDRRKKKEADAA